MIRNMILIVGIAFAASVGFAQDEVQTATVPPPATEAQINGLKRTIMRLQKSLDSKLSGQSAETRKSREAISGQIESLKEELQRQQRFRVEWENQQDILRKQEEFNHRKQQRMLLEISGGLLLIVVIGGGLLARAFRGRNKSIIVQSLVESATQPTTEASTPTTSIALPQLPDDPSPAQIKDYARRLKEITGSVEFIIKVRPSNGNPSLTGLAVGKMTENHKGDLVVIFQGVAPAGLDGRRAAARKHLLWMNPPPASNPENRNELLQ